MLVNHAVSWSQDIPFENVCVSSGPGAGGCMGSETKKKGGRGGYNTCMTLYDTCLLPGGIIYVTTLWRKGAEKYNMYYHWLCVHVFAEVYDPLNPHLFPVLVWSAEVYDPWTLIGILVLASFWRLLITTLACVCNTCSEYLASSPGPSQLFNVTRWKTGGPGSASQ